MDYSISLNGITSAYRSMQQAASRLATPDAARDLTADVVAVRQAEVAGRANLRMISAEQKLEDAILDIFA